MNRYNVLKSDHANIPETTSRSDKVVLAVGWKPRTTKTAVVVVLFLLWVSNSSSRGHWELDEARTVRNPQHMAEIGRRDCVSIGERQ